MMGTLRKFTDRLKSFFKDKPKPNINKVNISQVNTPTPMHGNAGSGSKGRATPKGVVFRYKNISPVKSAYRCNRAFLTQPKKLYF